MSTHGDIMNLPYHPPSIEGVSDPSRAYSLGHRDARHAAAELALKAEAMLEDYSDMIRKICFEYSAGGFAQDGHASEGLLPVATADDKLRWIIEDVQKGSQYSAAESLKRYDARIEWLESRLTYMTQWLEQNQSDVFSRGLWEAVDKAGHSPTL